MNIKRLFALGLAACLLITSLPHKYENSMLSQISSDGGLVLLDEQPSANSNPTLTPPPSSDVQPEPTAISDDYFSSSQWTLNNSGIYTHIAGTSEGYIMTTPDVDIDAPESWSLYNKDSYDTRTVVVAVIDTGVDYTHPDLEKNMWINTLEIPGDGIDNDGNGFIDDIYGWDFYNNDASVCHYEYNKRLGVQLSSQLDCDDHGTHVAGIIAATANNKIGIAGVASNVDVKIMSLKIHGGPDRKGSISDAIKAIKYAESMGADICSISWGSYTNSASLRTAISQSNMLFVCAAGNDGSNNNEKPLYPASYELSNVISVAYVDSNGALAMGSNYGSSTVDIAAPSVDVFSTIVGSYASMSGSSMAAPHVSGIAAMLYAYSPNLSAANVKSIILGSCKYMPSLDGYLRVPGIPSAAIAVSNVDKLVPDYEAPSMVITKSFNKDKIELNFQLSDVGSGVHALRYFIGRKTLEDFKHGTAGTLVSGNRLLLVKAGTYTFYLNDFSGNEIIKHFYIVDDTNPPVVTDSTYSVASSYKSITINAVLTDVGSGIKTIKYAEGEKNISDFSSGKTGTSLTAPDGKLTFKVTEPGKYTIYTADYRGNKSVHTINARIIKATALKLSRTKKTVIAGKTYKIKYTVSPVATTDKVSFKSSDKTIAKVSSTGKITGVSEGTATITVKTSSGIKKTFTVTVKKAEE